MRMWWWRIVMVSPDRFHPKTYFPPDEQCCVLSRSSNAHAPPRFHPKNIGECSSGYITLLSIVLPDPSFHTLNLPTLLLYLNLFAFSTSSHLLQALFLLPLDRPQRLPRHPSQSFHSGPYRYAHLARHHVPSRSAGLGCGPLVVQKTE